MVVKRLARYQRVLFKMTNNKLHATLYIEADNRESINTNHEYVWQHWIPLITKCEKKNEVFS